jgi:U3 small nucleolar RNA-associated protein 14
MLDKELLLEFELCLIPQVNSYGELERRMNDIKKIFEVPYEQRKKDVENALIIFNRKINELNEKYNIIIPD